MNQLTTVLKPLGRLINLTLALSYFYFLAFALWAVTTQAEQIFVYEAMMKKPALYGVLLGFLGTGLFIIKSFGYVCAIRHANFKAGFVGSYYQSVLDLLAIVSVFTPAWLIKNQLTISQSVNPVITIFLVGGIFLFASKRLTRLTRQAKALGV